MPAFTKCWMTCAGGAPCQSIHVASFRRRAGSSASALPLQMHELIDQRARASAPSAPDATSRSNTAFGAEPLFIIATASSRSVGSTTAMRRVVADACRAGSNSLNFRASAITLNMPTVAIEGHRFYYEEQGSGTPLLLIHGAGGHTGLFKNVMTRLASSHRVITYDRRGYTQSRAPLPSAADYLRRSADDAAFSAEGARRAARHRRGLEHGRRRRALRWAVHHPDAVSRLVLYEAPLHSKKHLGVRMTAAVGAALGLGRVGMHRRAAKRLLRYALGYKRGRQTRSTSSTADLPRVMAREWRARYWPRSRPAGVRSSRRAILGTIRVPVGDDRRLAPRPGSSRRRSSVRRRSSRGPRVVRVNGGDHVMNIRQPDLLVGAIRELLSP